MRLHVKNDRMAKILGLPILSVLVPAGYIYEGYQEDQFVGEPHNTALGSYEDNMVDAGKLTCHNFPDN